MEPITRAVLTPLDLAPASRCEAPLAAAPVPTCQAPLMPAPADPTPPSYDRRAWEKAVMASGLHPHARVLAFVLAHYAGGAGYIPPGHLQHPDSLAVHAGLTPRTARISLEALIGDQFIVRPPVRGWNRERGLRPITLTLPPSTGEPR